MVDIPGLFAGQVADCRALGSPFIARVLDMVPGLLDPDSALGRRVLTAPALPEEKLPLRLAGALHALARAGDGDLAPVYPPHQASDAALAKALVRTLTRAEAMILPWLDHPPQTNEVARSAVLIAAGHWLTAHYRLPLILSELGASAGVNLLWDHYALDLPGLRLGPSDAVLSLTPDWRGDLPTLAPPQVLDRAGVDLAPLDPVADRARLLAFIWADQTARLARCAAALDLAARLRPAVARGDAGDWAGDWAGARLPQVQAQAPAAHLIFHTVAATYFSGATTRRWQSALARAGAAATPDRPLAHLAMEGDGPAPGAALTLTLWPGALVIPLGRADFHGRWVDWQAPTP